MQQNKFEEAREQLGLALELREEQLRRNPGSAGVKHDLAHAIGYYVNLPIPPGREADAEALMKRNLVLVKELVRDFPDTFDYVTRLAMAYRGYGQFLMNYERYSESRDLHLEYVEFLKRSQQKFVTKDQQRGSIGWAFCSVGANLLELGLVEDARTAFRSARENFEQHIVDVPHDLRAKWYLAVFLAECPDESVNDAARAKVMLTQIVAEAPQTREYWTALAAAEHRLKNWQGVRDALSKATALAAEPVAVVEKFGLAIADWHLGDKEAAVASYRIAAGEMDRLSIRQYDTRKWRNEARVTLGLAE